MSPSGQKTENSVCSKLCSQPEFKMPIAFRKRFIRLAFSFLLATAALAVQVQAASDKASEAESKDTPKPTATPNFKPESITSTGKVTVGGSQSNIRRWPARSSYIPSAGTTQPRLATGKARRARK